MVLVKRFNSQHIPGDGDLYTDNAKRKIGRLAGIKFASMKEARDATILWFPDESDPRW